jgi:hypothetical protein
MDTRTDIKKTIDLFSERMINLKRAMGIMTIAVASPSESEQLLSLSNLNRCAQDLQYYDRLRLDDIIQLEKAVARVRQKAIKDVLKYNEGLPHQIISRYIGFK